MKLKPSIVELFVLGINAIDRGLIPKQEAEAENVKVEITEKSQDNQDEEKKD